MTMGNTGGTALVVNTGGAMPMDNTGGAMPMDNTGGTSSVGGSSGMYMPMNCGDGVCDVAMESRDNCLADCATLTYPPGSPGSGVLQVKPTTEQPDPGDVGAFRTVCAYSHMSTDDPLVFPGQPGRAHLHTYFGNTGANAFSTHESLRVSGNSTCRGGIANRTAYWIPSLIGPSGPMAPLDANFYYKSGYSIPNAAPQVHKIPNGLRMIAGDGKATGPQSTRIASWGCHQLYSGHHPQIIDCPVGDAIQLTVVFPQCWNGVDLDSPDHKSHLAYPENGACPSTHPVILPEISLNVGWERTASLDITKLRLASDMYSKDLPGGYSGHADWLEAWDPEIRDTFVTQCVNKSVDCHSHLLGDGREIY